MSTDGKNEIGGYSADYRDAHAGGPKKEAKSRKGSGKQKKPEPNLENDTEIDDFLPEEDSGYGERLLTKWDDGIETPEPEKLREKRSGRHRYGIFAGSVVLLLALAGVVSIVAFFGMKIHAALTDDTKLRAYDKFLTIVVAQDPQPFDSPDKADPDFVLNASLWQTMTSDGASAYTNYDKEGRTIVPLGDVADACHELFGPNCRLEPKNPTQETFYEYDTAKSQFHISLYSLDSTYVPYTVSAKRKGDGMVLRVGYVPPSDETRAQSSSVSSGSTPKPTKYMEYVLKTNPTTQKEYIYSINKAT